ncbi:MAG: polysaccharide deacetylase family protein [Candidatus Omnitrophica bacterium]|nr:polysaccharide deacetylase family protein [Candidatus Omnitrophota bacterium]
MKSFLKVSAGIFLSFFILWAAAFLYLPMPGHIPVLMYHFLGSEQDAAQSKNVLSTKSFERQMNFLKNMGYRVISLDELYEIKNGLRKPRGREIAITFDDGNYTFETLAAPILQKFQFPVAVFIISDNIRHKQHGSMTQEAIQRLMNYPWVTFGSHSQNHPFLTEVDKEKLQEEIMGSKEVLEEMFDVPFYYFSYPYGVFDLRSMDMVKQAGYRLAFTTSFKKLHGIKENPFALTRVKITRSSDNLFAYWFKTSGLYQGFKAFRSRFIKSQEESDPIGQIEYGNVGDLV